MVRAILERSMVSRLPSPRILVVAGLMTLALVACGRRGALEAPPGTAAVQSETQQGSTLPSPVGKPNRSRGAGFVVPNRSFILDPLL
jgi:predicted small lipoprotein YifL